MDCMNFMWILLSKQVKCIRVKYFLLSIHSGHHDKDQLGFYVQAGMIVWDDDLRLT